MSGGALASRPIPARWADGHVQVFARGTDGHLYTSDSTGGVFGAFTVLNPSQVIAGEPSVLVYAAYGPEIFARDTSGDVIHMWNASGAWSAWANDFGQVVASDPMAWLRADGLAEVFGVDGSGNLVKSLHSGATWTSWSTIATGVDACLGGTKLIDAGVPVVASDGGLVVPDAGLVVMDAGIASHDAGTRAAKDGGAARAGDDASVAGDGGSEGAAAAGCSCRSAAPGGKPGRDVALAGLVMSLVVVARRRRRG
jgi:MYXO-CTERM domain-containing protein